MTFRSPIFELSHTYVDDAAALSPMGLDPFAAELANWNGN
jgi:hypothetical protein